MSDTRTKERKAYKKKYKKNGLEKKAKATAEKKAKYNEKWEKWVEWFWWVKVKI